ncbi:major facilitator superfamily domain-containing protein, partial [Plectosphaerella plurivora]
HSDTGDDLMQTLRLTSHEYIIALMLFLIAYSVFEPASNLALKIFSPTRWLGFLIICFGAFCTAIAATNNFASVSALRFLLGAFEAGVFPGIIYYISFWYKPEERALRIAGFLCSATLAGAFGGCIAYGVGYMNGTGGLQAWRWLFILEGIPSIIFGFLVFFFLPSYPESCNFLTDEEKSLQARRIGEMGQKKQKLTWTDAKATLLDTRLLVHYLAYTGAGCLIASLSLFAPTIVLGLGFEGLRAQLFTVPPYVAAFLSTVGAAAISDRFKLRGPVIGTSMLICSVGFIVLGMSQRSGRRLVYIFLIISTSGAFAGLPSMNAWIGDNVTNTTAMSLATALNIAFSGPGQIIGVWIYRPQDRPFYSLGHGVNAGFAVLTTCISFSLSYHYHRMNAAGKTVNGRPWMK